MIKRLVLGVVVWRLFGPLLTPRFRAGQEHPLRIPARTVFVGDREFLVRQMGSGPDLILIHGLNGSSLAEWYKLTERLAGRFTVTLVDHRNHGLSSRNSDRFEIEDVADDVAAVMTEVGIGAADVVGYSMGGVVAQALAGRHPYRVRHLVLIATMSWHPTAMRRARQIGTLMTRAWERVTGFGTPEVRALYLVLTGAVDRRHGRWMWEENQRRDPDAGAATTFALLRFDSRPWLARISAPALVLIPTNDWLVPPAWQYELAALLPKVEVIEIPDGRHEIPWTHPDEVAGAIEDFLP